MPIRTEGDMDTTEFDWSPELADMRYRVEDILETYNPHAPATLDLIMHNVMQLVQRVDVTWAHECSTKRIQDSGKTISQIFSALLSTREEE